jgi:hypothetical protein
MRILFSKSGQICHLDPAVVQSRYRFSKAGDINPGEIDPVRSHTMRLVGTSLADEFERSWVVVADTCLKSRGTTFITIGPRTQDIRHR